MQGDRPLPTSPHSSSSADIYFCSICDKPYSNKASRDRHFQYCRRHVRNRPRSCQACNTAKTKCSFEVPCLRCKKRGIECIYVSGTANRHAVSGGMSIVEESRKKPDRRQGTSSASTAWHADDSTLPSRDSAFSDGLAMEYAQCGAHSGETPPPSEMTTQSAFPIGPLTFDDLFALEDDISPQHRCWAELSLAPQEDLDLRSPHWCAWMRGNVSLALVSDTSPMLPTSNTLSMPHCSPSQARHNADIIIQSLRSLPTMMTRRETFPWFIHPRLSEARDASLSEALSNCMSIAQMFSSRTSETRLFLRRTMAVEHRRVQAEMYQMPKFELLAAMQACMIYLIIYIIEYSLEDEGEARELLLGLHDLYMLFKVVGGRASDQTAVLKASTVWKDWIFAESQIRFANLWLLVGIVVCIKNGNIWDASQSYRYLPLPSPKTVWEAPTQSTWEAEYGACRCTRTNGLVTLGDLVDAQQSAYTPYNARKLDIWNAGVDNLGSLLNLVGSMQ